ncbi:unnamed protein product [Arabidopsis lyrata]|uniref:uncharacterized protein LOC110227234 n=1 Tax=Arabidopsis lyrata subsp. lyrata TaxID=81972 RepID=UPI000A29DAE1|nr:uncharacterized protein LOC110227234 [Arabidopsis lyrata subsp. lyrata]CAH8273213.1 unnamed protein product [Arabidopsis lyrata]|eukprot:XP_020876496.1 uncharacterized protein LOC110227234 [Arabidopsis lyrata subsp. lyrata]
MSKDNMIMFSYELSSSSLMEVNKEEIPQVHNLFQSEEDEEDTSLGKRKINTNIKTEDEREVKRIAFFSQEPLEEGEEEDIDMIEEDTEREDHRDDNDKIMEDNVREEESVVDFDGFF